MRKNGKLNTTYMVEMALLIAIILIMAFTPIGYDSEFAICIACQCYCGRDECNSVLWSIYWCGAECAADFAG